MEISNSFNLQNEEVVKLLKDLALSLESTGTLSFAVKGSAANLPIGSQFNVSISFTDKSFVLDLEWQGEDKKSLSDKDWREEFDKDMQSAGLVVPKNVENIPSPDSSGSTPEIAVETNLPPAPAARLPSQMQMETSTISNEPGNWVSSFSLGEQGSTWSELIVNEELENTQWTDEDDLISAPLVESQGIKRKEIPIDTDDDDLFASLDEIEPTKPKLPPKSRIPSPQQARTNNSSLVNQDTMKEHIVANDWKEPSREDIATDDDWVKPSEFLKQKAAVPKSSPITKSQLTTKKTKKATIPQPDKATNKIISDVKNWKEPSPTQNDDEWVKPSEVLKAKKKDIPAPQGANDPRYKKPPTAPDKKKKEEKKGWANW